MIRCRGCTAAVAANDSGSVAGLRDAALLAVASDGLLRVSEVAALDVGDMQAEADGSGRLLVGESKTDQEGQGAVLYLGALTVSRVSAWLGPLFRHVRRGGPRRRRSRAPAVSQRHPPNHPQPGEGLSLRSEICAVMPGNLVARGLRPARRGAYVQGLDRLPRRCRREFGCC